MTLSRSGNVVLAALAACLIGLSLWQILGPLRMVRVEAVAIEGTPATIFRPTGVPHGPVVVIAHGFAGSQQLMAAFAVTFARGGYTAMTFDFLGHGRNPRPLVGDVTREDGATAALVGETATLVRHARGLGDGRVALLGHSMASDVVVRAAIADPGIAATIAVSMFSRAVTRAAPRDLLVISGEWESGLRAEASKAAGLVSAPEPPVEGVTYGSLPDGTARRAAVAGGVEHIGVLYSRDSLREALDWLDGAFGVVRGEGPALDRRGPWILTLFAGLILLARPLSRLLPVVASRRLGAGLAWRRLWLVLLVPATATPLLLRLAPTERLAVPVGGYLAAHFALYGLIAWVMLWRTGGPADGRRTIMRMPAFVAAVVAVLAYLAVSLGWTIDALVTSFVPVAMRWPLLAIMLVGTTAFFTADEWATRGEGAARFGPAGAKVAFVLSLAFAVVLDFRSLFFLIIIVPVIVPAFVVGGLFSAWIYRRTRHPLIAGLANAALFAWALGVTFPILAT